MPKRAKSSRELRRQKARQDRRLLYEMENSSLETQKAALYRNGITVQDLEQEYANGAKDGRQHAEEFAFHAIYAAFLIVMIDHHKMDRDKAVELLREIDHQVVVCIEDEELIKDAYEKTDVELNWKDPLERIETKEA